MYIMRQTYHETSDDNAGSPAALGSRRSGPGTPIPGRESADVGVSGMRDRVLLTGKGGRGMFGGLPGDGGAICRSGGECLQKSVAMFVVESFREGRRVDGMAVVQALF